MRSPVFKGATAPAMLFGIPIIPFLLFNGAGGLITIYLTLIFIGGPGLLFLLVVIAIDFWMRRISDKDPYALNQLWLWWQTDLSGNSSGNQYGRKITYFAPGGYRKEKLKP